MVEGCGAGCFEKFAHFLFGAQILIQEEIITAGIPFFQTLDFPHLSGPDFILFLPLKYVGETWQDKHAIACPSFFLCGNSFTGVFVCTFGGGS